MRSLFVLLLLAGCAPRDPWEVVLTPCRYEIINLTIGAPRFDRSVATGKKQLRMQVTDDRGAPVRVNGVAISHPSLAGSFMAREVSPGLVVHDVAQPQFESTYTLTIEPVDSCALSLNALLRPDAITDVTVTLRRLSSSRPSS